MTKNCLYLFLFLFLFLLLLLLFLYQGVCLKHMFGKNSTSLIVQLPEMLPKAGWEKVRATILGGILEYIEHLMKNYFIQLLEPYAHDLIKICERFVRGDKSSQAKTAACHILSLILAQHFEIEIDATGLINMFFKELQIAKSKQTATSRGANLAVLGLLSDMYPTVMNPHARNLALIYMETLESETKKDHVEAKLIAGVFEGLVNFLDNFSEIFPEDARERNLRLSTLFKHVREGLSTGDMKKYDILRAALNIFTRHAPLFKQFFAEDGDPKLLNTLITVSKHSNNEIRSKGTSALEETFLQPCFLVVFDFVGSFIYFLTLAAIFVNSFFIYL